MRKKISQINVKPIRFSLDSDRDGVKDYNDCKPFNPKYQHISKRKRKEFDELPISIVKDVYFDYSEDLFPLSSRRKEVREAKEQIYSILKRHPELASRIKKIKGEWVKKGRHWIKDDFLRVGMKSRKEPTAESYGGMVILESLPLDFYGEYEKEIWKMDYPCKKLDVSAGVIHHELAHEEQALRDPRWSKKADSFTKKHIYRGLHITKRSEAKEEDIIHERYLSNPFEVECNRIARERLRERLKKVPQREVEKGFRKFMEY